MPDSFTANLGMVKPEVGASRDSWGAKWNVTLDQLDTFLWAAMPIGALLDYAGANAPAGWLLCDGLQYLITDHPALFARIGNRWGGDGVTYFAVPDFRAHGAVGVGTGTDTNGASVTYALGQKLGFFYQYITRDYLPNYQLNESSDGNHQHNGYGVTDAQGDHVHGGYTDAQGAHDHGVPTQDIRKGSSFDAPMVPYADFSQRGIRTDVNGVHQHNLQIAAAGAHQHNVSITTSAGQGGHYHAPMLGGYGVALSFVDPVLAVTKIIFAGPPPTPGIMRALQAPPLAMMTPLRGMH